MTSTVTYSPEDDKIRLYVGRVPRADYDALRAAGFQATPKQDCDFVAVWTPEREDLAREFLEDGEDIGDEGYSATERAADRAERFEAYQDKRTAEAIGSADRFEQGPAAFGHQNQGRAERPARRHDRHRIQAVTQWAKAEYWSQRTAGVIANALHRADPRTRRGRIKTLETEMRKHVTKHEEYRARFSAWTKVLTLEGADQPGQISTEPGESGFVPGTVTPALRVAYALANVGSYGSYKHPRTGFESSLCSHLTDARDPITPAEAARLWLAGRPDPDQPDSYSARWLAHYQLRLTYEKAMLANEGGAASDVEMTPGGFLGSMQIIGINRSNATGKVVSVRVSKPGGKIGLYNVEKLPESAYRPPTAAELEEFQKRTAEEKQARKATATKAPPLINPTDEDAMKLQRIWNDASEQAHKRSNGYGPAPKSTPIHMTQAEYSERSKGSYAYCETSEISERLLIRQGYHDGNNNRTTVFKIRTASAGGFSFGPRRVVVITDKPQKALPWAEVEAVRATMPTPETVRPRLIELHEAQNVWPSRMPEELRQLMNDARYLGWYYCQSETQHGFTEAGNEVLKQVLAEAQPATV